MPRHDRRPKADEGTDETPPPARCSANCAAPTATPLAPLFDPIAPLIAGFDPSAPLIAGFDPSAPLIAGFDPIAPLIAGFDPSALPANREVPRPQYQWPTAANRAPSPSLDRGPAPS